ncbi:hypothetical protein TPY_0570 [Sulfobacillus acidophilus TPY]|uniref:Uncharacterized protein n=1 Tax=Sulfobacillus acidophilus (strain ATCC 700253 / DSM 10332 / NAL) TaxID=679936 RepID=G8U0X9_SULAD|nr:hypothetical protein TPY_0570 [Sulfobacillus acidophilus TPY]AEW06524.1 hypothetical protein Sulac_3067 [Sulfobacillus acidophilus DSM 10332]
MVCTFRIGGALIGESVIARQSGHLITGHAGGRFQGVQLQAEIRGSQLVGRYHRHWASPCFTVDLEDMPPLLGFAAMTLACYHLTQVYHTPEIS